MTGIKQKKEKMFTKNIVVCFFSGFQVRQHDVIFTGDR